MLSIIRDNFIQNLYKVYVNQIKYRNIKILTTTNNRTVPVDQYKAGREEADDEDGQWSFDWSFLESVGCLLPSNG